MDFATQEVLSFLGLSQLVGLVPSNRPISSDLNFVSRLN